MKRLYIENEDDRLKVAAILVKNGYMVMQGRRKRANGKQYDKYLDVENGPTVPVSPEENEQGRTA